ncbi:hypothetical protein [Haloarchaeobius sp. HME9146]|nr:hypothetical protein [Haloarchaeobius sp. HME9146]MCT9094891.1 hypothetical protein [Haloarchaeobius sp. HME9146]
MEPLEDPPEPVPTGLVGRLRHHVRTWPQRYIDMQVDALSGWAR